MLQKNRDNLIERFNKKFDQNLKETDFDFSKVKVTRNQIKAIMASMAKAQALPDVSRFNWKDGFYSPEKMEEYRNSNERAKANGNNPRTSPKGKRVATKNKPKKR